MLNIQVIFLKFDDNMIWHYILWGNKYLTDIVCSFFLKNDTRNHEHSNHNGCNILCK